MYPIQDDQQFIYELLQESKVLLVQGTGFNWGAPDHFRIVFLPHEEDLREAITRVGRFLKAIANVTARPEPPDAPFQNQANQSQTFMNPIKVGLLGIGTVGSGTFNVLKRNQEEIRRRAGRGIEIAVVADLNTERAAS
jgi:hypothetical protein